MIYIFCLEKSDPHLSPELLSHSCPEYYRTRLASPAVLENSICGGYKYQPTDCITLIRLHCPLNALWVISDEEDEDWLILNTLCRMDRQTDGRTLWLLELLSEPKKTSMSFQQSIVTHRVSPVVSLTLHVPTHIIYDARLETGTVNTPPCQSY